LLRRLRCHVGDDAAWGFGAKWLPTFLGTPPPNKRVLALAVMLHGIAIALALAGLFRITTALIVISSLLAIISLRLFARPERPAKTKGIHGSFPVFVRVAYVWLIIAALLGVWAANAPNPSGIWGASRHALTVGFISVMVFCVGQRMRGSKPLAQWRTQGRWPESYDQLWELMNEKHGRQGGTRSMVALICMGREFGYAKLETAVAQAMELGCTDVAAIRHLLMSDKLQHAAATTVAIGALTAYERPLPTMAEYNQLLCVWEIEVPA
jgi:hypothetical protein